ncbi:Hypothetical protein ETEE_3290 [Edwardsiella anguillarum ET080813]|uniref:Uncharacterized protein n=1 Tax=Edwardsiella anguillarum ET080813 TaxID=667120 RepID=A0A076LW39_9GAMM|nr:Hypothetical protein ETEE_3290 [Edwardsiella anguillarum ET080813]
MTTPAYFIQCKSYRPIIQPARQKIPPPISRVKNKNTIGYYSYRHFY